MKTTYRKYNKEFLPFVTETTKLVIFEIEIKNLFDILNS